MDPKSLRNFLEIPYDELEEMNLAANADRINRVDAGKVEEKRRKYLTDEKRIKAVTVAFTDLEGRLHMLDFDKKHLLAHADHLTFDGSSIRGFTPQEESDLRLVIDWKAFYWLPADVFGAGKVLMFSDVCDREGAPFAADLRGRLREYVTKMIEKDDTVPLASTEIEGFLFKGRNAEQHYAETGAFEFVSEGGYFHSLPNDALRRFIDTAAEVQRAMGFTNEKDHPEVAPSQFEMNYSYAPAGVAADQIQLYKLLCRQVAANMDMTASFLPKPVMGINGNGMHTNISLSRGGRNIFFDAKGEDRLSEAGWDFVERVLHAGTELSLILNPSVNAYRRLDPAFEAPNQIKASANNRGAMIRIPFANERSARIEVRSVSPDANPYMLLYMLLRTGLEGEKPKSDEEKRPRTRFLPSNIYDAMRSFKSSPQCTEFLGEYVHGRFVDIKKVVADRCPRALGTLIKRSEVKFHHEVTNQLLWSRF